MEKCLKVQLLEPYISKANPFLEASILNPYGSEIVVSEKQAVAMQNSKIQFRPIGYLSESQVKELESKALEMKNNASDNTEKPQTEGNAFDVEELKESDEASITTFENSNSDEDED